MEEIKKKTKNNNLKWNEEAGQMSRMHGWIHRLLLIICVVVLTSARLEASSTNARKMTM